MLAFVNFYLIPGITLGSIYALGAIGVSLIFGILRFAHFAHGDLMTFGAYVALSLVASLHISPFAALPLAMLAAILMALACQHLFYRPLAHLPPIVTVIAAFGVALMLRSAIQLLWGVQIESYARGIQRPLVFLDSLRIAERHIWIVLLTLAVITALHLFLSRSRAGKAMRAVADEPELAELSGIDRAAVIRQVWIIGGGLAAMAGVFLGIDTELSSNMGWNLLLPVFAAALLGGIGRPYGAIAGGFVIGLAEELSTYNWIGTEPFISPGYKSAIAFALMVALLLWRPQGLFRGSLFQ